MSLSQQTPSLEFRPDCKNWIGYKPCEMQTVQQLADCYGCKFFEPDDGKLLYETPEAIIFEPEVIEGLVAQDLGSIFKNCIGVVSNNPDEEAFQDFVGLFGDALGVKVHGVCRAEGYYRKPYPQMGLVIADKLGIKPRELGIVGDRRLSDVWFGQNIGAKAIALCARVGDKDSRCVNAIRRIEAQVVKAEIALGLAT